MDKKLGFIAIDKDCIISVLVDYTFIVILREINSRTGNLLFSNLYSKYNLNTVSKFRNDLIFMISNILNNNHNFFNYQKIISYCKSFY